MTLKIVICVHKIAIACHNHSIS